MACLVLSFWFIDWLQKERAQFFLQFLANRLQTKKFFILKISMFEYLGSTAKIWVYLDYSNMHYTKYNLWWDYNISQFIHECLNDSRIFRIAFYGAYDPKNISQYNWVQRLQNTFTDPRNYFFFKKLEQKWWKNKGNVDTECWYWNVIWYFKRFTK